jgi:hypothetical protein
MFIPRRLVLLAALVCPLRSAAAQGGSAAPDTARLGRDVRFLASDALEGRRTGTPRNDSAAAYNRRRVLGILPGPASGQGACRSANGRACGTTRVAEQPFVARPAAAAHTGTEAELPTRNVVAVIEGSDPALRNQYVVIGAHYDHLGRSTFGAMDPERPNEIRNGADDNASGTAAVLELARLFAAAPPRRSIVIVAFSGEELGLLGSQYFVEHSPVPLDSVQAMLNFDMVGRLRDDKLIVYGVATALELPQLLERANVAPALKLSAVGDGFGPSDQSSFYAKDLPVLHFFTDAHADYHRVSDDADKIDLGGIARVVAFAGRVARELADRPARLTFTRAPVSASAPSSSRTGSQVYLGSIPDMGASEVPGLRLSGVRPGSPADSAGLKAGDVVVELGGRAVKDLTSYSEALYAHQPGDRVTIVALREGKRITTEVTLGKRN